MENYEGIRLPWPDWKIVKYLGGGAYGKVYEIERNISGVQEKAALKIVSRPKDDNEIDDYYANGYDQESIIASYENEIRDYVQEYRLMKELQGESNIVSCDDFTVVPHENGIGGDIFIRMELLTSLQQILKDRMLSVEEIIKLGKDISHALVLCESKNIIHRDIKPANIMVSQFGNYKLGDFGVSKIMDHATYATPMGTPEYEAPEIKHMEKYGQAVDIYSLGITLYWLLNNRRMPFIGADEQITPARRSEAMEKRYAGKEKLPKPKNGSKRLKEIVLKACEYDPANRYESAQEMYDALDALGNEKPTVYPIPVKKPENPDDGGNGSVTVGRNGVSGSESDRNGGGQTQGNSWVENGGTIGKPGGPNGQNKVKDKGHSEVTDPGTVGVKEAYRRQEKEDKEKAKITAEINQRHEKSINSKRKNVGSFGRAIRGILNKSEDEIDENGKVFRRTYFHKNGKISSICEIDKNGLVRKSTDYRKNGIIEYESESDENGNITKFVSYDEQGELKEYIIDSYDENQKKQRCIIYEKNGAVSSDTRFEYDRNGNQIKSIRYDGAGNLTGYWIKEYDSNNNKIKQTYYDAAGNAQLAVN